MLFSPSAKSVMTLVPPLGEGMNTYVQLIAIVLLSKELSMHVEELAIPGVRVLTPSKHRDHRGFLSEVYNRRTLARLGIGTVFVQDNHSVSARTGTVRGLHFQAPPRAQDKLVRVVRGSVFDVAVDLRRGSPTYGLHVSIVLSALPDASDARDASDRPSIGATSSGAAPSPAASSRVGKRSRRETFPPTRRGANANGACTIRGARTDRSKNDILKNRPRSPSESPWSDVNTTRVSSAAPISPRVSSNRPTFASI